MSYLESQIKSLSKFNDTSVMYTFIYKDIRPDYNNADSHTLR